VLQSRQMISDSRRWLDRFYRKYPPTPTLTKCLLCGEQGADMHHLGFRARSLEDSNQQYPTAELNAHLAGFGVCRKCVLRHQGDLATGN
jgi:hypothetical protein